jgi:hypothetical protein
MKNNTAYPTAKAKKRIMIEADLAEIIKTDRIKILIDNMRRRQIKEFFKGDTVKVMEKYGKGENCIRDADCMYRVSVGTVVQVTPGGYLVEGQSHHGIPSRDFVNRSHLISGTVTMDHYIS